MSTDGSRSVRAGKRLFKLSFGKLERPVSVIGGLLAIIGVLTTAAVTGYHKAFPDVPWRTRADNTCLRYMDEYAAGEFNVWDEPELLKLWVEKYDDLGKIDVPVQYELDWRAYRHAEGDLLSYVFSLR